MTLKIAVLAPIPSAMMTTAVMANTGLFRSVRNAYRRSFDGIGGKLPQLLDYGGDLICQFLDLRDGLVGRRRQRPSKTVPLWID